MYENWPRHVRSQENCIGFLFKTPSTIKYSPSHTCQFVETFLSTSLNFFIFIPHLALSGQHLDLSSRFPGQEIKKTKRYGRRPSGMLLPTFGVPCLKASGKVSLFMSVFQSFSENSLLWKLSPSTLTKICSVIMLILAVDVMTVLMARMRACVRACAHV